MNHLQMNQLKKSTLIINQYHNSITHLPESILIEILCKLPTKTLFQLKCISKQWLFLISSSDFAAIYTSKVSEPPKTAFFLTNLETPKSPRSNLNPEKIVGVEVENFGNGNLFSKLMINGFHPKLSEIVGYCDGLLLCCDASKPHYCICNVITHEIVEVKQPDMANCPIYRALCGWVCNVGNGYVKSYFLVLLRRDVEDLVKVLIFHVYFSECNEWKMFKVSCPRQLDNYFFRCPLSQGIPYKGILHWVNVVDGYIIAYDPFGNPDRCRIIDLPGENFTHNAFHMFGRVCSVSEGSLRYLEMDNKYWTGPFPRFRVWKLHDYEKGEWVLEHNVAESVYFADECLKRDISLSPKDIYGLRPLFFHPLCKDVVYFLTAFGIVSYNVQKKRLVMEVEVEDRIRELASMDVIPIVFSHWPLRIGKPILMAA